MFEGTLDNVVGIFYAKDLLTFLDTANMGSAAIRRRCRLRFGDHATAAVCAADETAAGSVPRISDRQVHMAVVLDEYGGTPGW